MATKTDHLRVQVVFAEQPERPAPMRPTVVVKKTAPSRVLGLDDMQAAVLEEARTEMARFVRRYERVGELRAICEAMAAALRSTARDAPEAQASTRRRRTT
jgi:hypothetical protein